MQIILAPSKTMTMARKLPAGLAATSPYFSDEATQIASEVRTTTDIAEFMQVSQPIAEKVVRMYNEWGDEKAPAIVSYIGDVYKGFHAETLTHDDLTWAQQHLFIMSGLYGVLRPFDEISPYRLEMKAGLKIGRSKNLYEFWDEKLARHVDRFSGGVICNLSSDEYGRPVVKHAKSRAVTPVFLDNKTNGKIGTVPIYSKMMRGVLARWMIDNRIDDVADLTAFRAQGYTYDPTHSAPNQPAFYREKSAPIVF